MGSIRPAPAATCGASPSPSLSTAGLAVVTSAERIAAGDQSGCSCVSSAPAPATIGDAIEVPDRTLNCSRPSRPSCARYVSGLYAASTLTPGAATSGRSRSAFVPGPREENHAIRCGCQGVADAPANDALAPAAAARLSAGASDSSTNSDGTRPATAGSSAVSRSIGMIMPAAPAARRTSEMSPSGANGSQMTRAPRTRSGVMPPTQ